MADERVPEHPGLQCHDAHPGVPHATGHIPGSGPPAGAAAPAVRVAAPADLGALLEPAGALTVDPETARLLLGSDPWTRFDVWAERAHDLIGQAIEAAKAEGERTAKAAGTTLDGNMAFDPTPATMIDAAKVCQALAEAANPLAALPGLPPRLGSLDLPDITLRSHP